MYRIKHILLLVATFSAAPLVADEYKEGDRVVCIADAAISLPNEKVGEVWPGIVLTVNNTNGRYLWVSRGRFGWLDSKYVVPLNRAAIDHMTALVRANPNEPGVYSSRALVWEALEEFDAALGDYNEALRLDPSFAGYLNRGHVWKK